MLALNLGFAAEILGVVITCLLGVRFFFSRRASVRDQIVRYGRLRPR